MRKTADAGSLPVCEEDDRSAPASAGKGEMMFDSYGIFDIVQPAPNEACLESRGLAWIHEAVEQRRQRGRGGGDSSGFQERSN